MPHPLQTRVEAVRGRAARLLWMYGLSRFAAAAVGIIILLALADYGLRLHDAAGRWLFSLMALLGIAGAFMWLGWPALRPRKSPIEVARRIESRFPALEGRLSSAVAFLDESEDDPRAGSAALRKAVVAEAAALSADLDFRKALDSRQPRRAATVAAIAFFLFATLAGLNPAAANLALARLAMPWRAQPWPRRHELAFVSTPSRLATGDDFEVQLVNRRGKLPDDVRIHLRLHTALGTRKESHDMQPLGERAVYRLSNVAHSLDYRASGGDDDTLPWTRLEVIEPPKVVELTIEVTPPEYAGRSPRQEGRLVKAIAGSTLAVRGRLDKPIASAIGRTETDGFDLPSVSLDDDGLSFAAPAGGAWTIEKSGNLWFELTDENGLVFGRDTRIELQVLPDSPPAIAWEAPIDHTFVTPRALVPVQALVKDDLAIRGVQLRFLRPGASEAEQVIELYAGPAKVAASRGSTIPDGDSQSIDYEWDLARLPHLQPGDVLAVRITAEDYKPQLATSIVRRLTIVTEEELENRVSQRQTSILSQLAEALRIARQCREQTGAIEIRLSEAEVLEAGDLNHLQSAQLNGRQLEKLLGDEADGVAGQLIALLEELAANRVGSQAAKARLEQLLAEVRKLNSGPLPAIEQELSQAFKTAREVIDVDDPNERDRQPVEAIIARLRAAGVHQDEAIASLETMLGALAEWDSFSRLAREIGAIRSDQESLADETETLRLATVAAAGDSPPAEARAGGRQAAQRELDLARRLDKIQSRMEEMLTRLEASDPLAAGTLADGLDVARRLAIGGQMREAALRLSALRFGPARERQLAVLEGLKQLLDTLSSRRNDELKRSIAALSAAAGDLATLLDQSRQAQGALAAAAQEADAGKKDRELQRLAREMERLAEEVDKLERQLERLRAQQPAQSLAQAAGKSRDAGQSAAGGNADEAQQGARDAQRLLEEAQAQLAQDIDRKREELAREEQARIEQFLAGLAARQKNVLQGTQRIDGMKQNGALPAEQEMALRGIAAEQRLLAEEAVQLRAQLAAKAFDFAMESIEERMGQAAGLLLRGETGAPTQTAEQAALSRLEQMLAALKPDEPAAEKPPPDGQAQPAGDSPPPGNFGGMLAELKLLKLLQEAIYARTAELEAIRAQEGALPPPQEEELDQLAREQGRLADMVLDLIEAASQRPEDEMELLPEGDNPPPDAKKSLDDELLQELET